MLCAKALLDAGSDPEARDAKGASALAAAESSRHLGCLRMMRLHVERRQQAVGERAGSMLRRAVPGTDASG
jgi:hypothetical protein